MSIIDHIINILFFFSTLCVRSPMDAIRTAEKFSLRPVGYAGIITEIYPQQLLTYLPHLSGGISKEETALLKVLMQSDALNTLKRLLTDCTPEGKLYVLVRLKVQFPSSFLGAISSLKYALPPLPFLYFRPHRFLSSSFNYSSSASRSDRAK